jgi:hypothetical protein
MRMPAPSACTDGGAPGGPDFPLLLALALPMLLGLPLPLGLPLLLAPSRLPARHATAPSGHVRHILRGCRA